MADFDFSELYKLAADLGDTGPDVAPNVKKAVEVTARHVKDDWRKGARRTGLRAYAASVDYDMQTADSELGAEIGPNLGKSQGSFGFVEDAPGGVRSSPQHAGRKAAKKAEADFVKGVEKAIDDTLKARGL